jgi:hypothetical protein
LGRLVELHARFKDRVKFLMISIREAHPERKTPGDLRTFVRAQLEELHVPFTCVLDNGRGEAATAYKAWPLRLVIVEPGGRIAYDARTGMFERWDLDEADSGGWDLDGVGTWLEAHAGSPAWWPHFGTAWSGPVTQGESTEGPGVGH